MKIPTRTDVRRIARVSEGLVLLDRIGFSLRYVSFYEVNFMSLGFIDVHQFLEVRGTSEWLYIVDEYARRVRRCSI